MDIAILGNQSIKIKGKHVAFVVDPTKEMPKTSSDAIIILDNNDNIDIGRINDSRIIISGPGGYEVGGAKISGTKIPTGTLYKFSIDNINVILGSATEEKIEGFNACEVAIINANSNFNESFVTALEPKMTILYGDKKNEAAKTLGAESVSLVSKIAIVKDKLPEKMEIIALG